jgi:hypothetical protein
MSLQSIIEDLETIADWRDDLGSKVRRASLRFEFCGLDADEQGQLAAEVKTFNDVCRCLSSAIRSEVA